METGSPSLGKVVTMALFALSCAGLLLFLWISFGGTIPLSAQGYRINVSFPYADQLATEADVRIAGVDVGKVVSEQLDPRGNRTIATLEIDRPYEPIHRDAQAILRQKTIIGETYVGLTPGSPGAPIVPDGGMLSRSQVTPAVQLSQVFDALDPKTRRAFQVWQQELSTAVRGNASNLSNVLGNIPTFTADATDILRVLDIERSSVVGLVRNGGTVFSALGQDQAALRGVITSGEATLATTAANNNALAATLHVFPTFLNETKATMTRLKSFALDADPVVRELIPVANDLGPTLRSVRILSPYLRKLFVNLGPLITVSKTGLPAIGQTLDGATPLLASIGPFLEQLNPILGWLSEHQQLVSDFISNGAYGVAATAPTVGGSGLFCQGQPCGHYLRQFTPVGNETIAMFANRDPNNRGNTYPPSLWLADPQNLKKGNFPAWDCKNTGAPGDGSTPGTVSAAGAAGNQPCWVAPPLPGTSAPSTLPHITAAGYPNK